ncbi:hypothetical protein HYFRA_00005628 [Hymenoscyphus fraxineus]|uniref:SAP domain-containing protein n=1 Tax=Hymenoscyphus fraxineus TaxID=746836 RepID=A0A9N9KQ40_9HELO|nr:hypothetical protein HYFRA_00005628 [Hymenoscyphus fraxineus]
MTDWSKLKVVDLKAELKRRGLAQTGLKPALVARLAAAENEEGSESESEATIQGDSGRPGAAASAATSPDTTSPIQPPPDPTSQIPQNDPQDAAPESSIPQGATEAVPRTSPEPVVIQETVTQLEQLEQTAKEPTATLESPMPIPETHHSALPSAEPKEIVEDKSKRKRRSQTPPPSKRPRQEDEEMTGVEENANNEDKKDPASTGSERNPADVGVAQSGTTDFAMEGQDMVQESKLEPLPQVTESSGDTVNVDVKDGSISNDPMDISPQQPSRNYKELFTAPSMPSLEKSTSRDRVDAMETELPDRIIIPARHPATSALYIRNFMRPLNPGQLKNHIADLAAPPGRESDPEVITYFFLDPIRTHAFISFANVAAASRVRSAIHDRIWPDERSRRPLWADFIPVEKVEAWSEEEQAAGGGRATAKKWEVYYEEDEDRNVTAHLQEITNFPHQHPPRRPSNPIPPHQAPFQPRGIENAPSGPRAEQNRVPPARAMNGFSTLDQLFKSTTAKPLLYWKPVDKAVADKRLDNIDSATSQEARGRRLDGDMNRYTFEDRDVLVDRGPEIFNGLRPPPGFRGPRGNGSGGGPVGGGPLRRGYQGQGYGGRPERYDNYRRDNRRGMRDDRRY